MAVIDRDKLLSDARLWLPLSNMLTDAQMEAIAELLISIIGDDDKFYPEVLCKFLGAIADANIARAVGGDPNGYTQERVGDHSVSFGNGSEWRYAWKSFRDSLKTICPLFGYREQTSVGMASINSGGKRYNPLDNC